MNRKKLAAVGLAVTLSVSAAACGGTGEPEEAGAEAVAVEVQTPRTGELTVDTDQIDEMEDNLGDLRDAGGALAAAKEQAQAGVDQAVAAYAAMEERLRPQIDCGRKKDTRDRG